MSLIVWAAGAAQAAIDLQWRPAQQTVQVGDTFGLGLYAVSDSSVNQYFSATQVIIDWTPEDVQLLGLSQAGAIGLFSSSFPLNDAFGLNEASPPADGDALWVGLAFPGVLPATPAGTLLTTVRFRALAPTAGTNVGFLASGGNPLGLTKIIGEIPNLNVLGQLGSPAVTIILPEPAAGLFLLLMAAAGRSRARMDR